MPAPFCYDRSWEFPVPAQELWQVLSRTEHFPSWWSWLRTFDAPPTLFEGMTARCVVGPPLPYVIRFTVAVVSVVPGRLIATNVTGDLNGPARLEIESLKSGSLARLAWEVEARRPLLQGMARVARPVLEWGHDWVVETGVAQFRKKALQLDGARIQPP